MLRFVKSEFLVIPPKFARPREAGWLDEGVPEILRCAQDDKTLGCHPERSEGSLVDLWGNTSKFDGSPVP